MPACWNVDNIVLNSMARKSVQVQILSRAQMEVYRGLAASARLLSDALVRVGFDASNFRYDLHHYLFHIYVPRPG